MADIYVRSTDGSDADTGLTWALAKATLTGGLAVAAAGDTIWVSDAHSETTAAAITLTSPGTAASPCRILCGDDVAEPPTTLTTTGKVATTGASSITIVGFAYVFGIEFEAGSGAVTANINFGVVAPIGQIFESCRFDLNATGATGNIAHGQTTGGTDDSYVRTINCIYEFSATTHRIALQHGNIHIQGATLDGLVPATLFLPVQSAMSIALIEASDLNHTGGDITNLVSVAVAVPSQIIIRNCKMDVTNVTTGTHPGPGGPTVMLDNCDSADTNTRFAWVNYQGSIIQELVIVKDSGANDGTTAISWEMVSSANVKYWTPLRAPKPIAIWNETVGSAVTATVEAVNDGTTLTNAEFWGEFQFLGTAGFPQGSYDLDSRSANVLTAAANQTTSTVGWTTTGLASPVKQKLVHTFTPQEKGFILCWPCLARASKTVFVDPKITLS